MMTAKDPNFIALEGADGVGKSTVLHLLLPRLVEKGGFVGYTYFHWKPLPDGFYDDKLPGDNPHDPRGNGPRNPIASLAFFAYHWLGYWVGYFRYIRPALRRGRLVVADRWAWDLFLDPTRFRLNLPDWILRLGVRLLPHPARTLALTAPPATIIARKPELSAEEIEAYQSRLTKSGLVKNLFVQDASALPAVIVDEIVAKW